MYPRVIAVMASVFFAAGCVSQGTYDAAVERAYRVHAEDRAQLSSLQEQVLAHDKYADELRRQLDAANAELADLERLRREEARTKARAAHTDEPVPVPDAPR